LSTASLVACFVESTASEVAFFVASAASEAACFVASPAAYASSESFFWSEELHPIQHSEITSRTNNLHFITFDSWQKYGPGLRCARSISVNGFLYIPGPQIAELNPGSRYIESESKI
jgi:hypothetical protein